MGKTGSDAMWDMLRDEAGMARAIEDGASVDIERNGQPLLVAAVESGSPEVIEMLASRASNPGRPDLGGYTVFHALATRARVFSVDVENYRGLEVFEILRQLDVDVHRRDGLRGRTAADLLVNLSKSPYITSQALKVDLSTIAIGLGILAERKARADSLGRTRMAH